MADHNQGAIGIAGSLSQYILGTLFQEGEMFCFIFRSSWVLCALAHSVVVRIGEKFRLNHDDVDGYRNKSGIEQILIVVKIGELFYFYRF